MRLYLVQHAEAKSEREDPERPITPKGRTDTIAVANVAQRMDLAVDQIHHSGKTRAKQTAGILGQYINPKDGIIEADGLGPVDDVEPVGNEITAGEEDLMLVGHLPFMERLAGYLLTGDTDHKIIDFHNAALVCLKHEGGSWMVDWIVTPEIAS